MADFISQFRWVTAGNLKDLDDLPIRVMLGLPRARIVVKERRDRIFQMRKILFSNRLQQRKLFDETSPPFTDRVLPKTHLFGYLHIIETIRSKQDYLCTLYLAGRKCPAFGKFRKDGLDSFGYFYGDSNKWHINVLLVFSFIMPYIGDFFHNNITKILTQCCTSKDSVRKTQGNRK